MKVTSDTKKSAPKMTPEQFANKHQQYFKPLPNALPGSVAPAQFAIFTTEDFSVPFYSSNGSVAVVLVDAQAEHA